jgi:hypothetical protein
MPGKQIAVVLSAAVSHPSLSALQLLHPAAAAAGGLAPVLVGLPLLLLLLLLLLGLEPSVAHVLLLLLLLQALQPQGRALQGHQLHHLLQPSAVPSWLP